MIRFHHRVQRAPGYEKTQIIKYAILAILAMNAAFDKDSTWAKWYPPSEIKDALRENDNSESERDGRFPERSDQDDFKDEMYVEKLISCAVTSFSIDPSSPKEKET
jgi:hypothetical protein